MRDLRSLVVALVLAASPVGHAVAQECGGLDCNPARDEAQTCSGQDCAKGPDDPVVECIGVNCLPSDQNPVQACKGEGCTPRKLEQPPKIELLK